MGVGSFATSEERSASIGAEIYALAAEIFPICRSITGDGVRATLQHLRKQIELEIHEVPTGTQVFDWVVPREWNIRDAFIKNARGERIVDFRRSNLHVVSYSTPVHAKLPLSELKKHIHTLPDQPDLVPYRTSYYEERWGFCLAHRQLMELPDGTYEVLIDASLENGSLTYGEYLHRGETEDEFLLSAHVCHPSLANDNASGLALLALLARELSGRRTRYSYRFLFAPGTIGAITWLARNQDVVSRIKHGLVVSCVGDGGGPTYKKSRRGDAPIDRIMEHVLHSVSSSAKIVDFFPYGYDERQYCSPGFNLPVGSLQRSQYGTFPEYHTSADDLDFIRPEHLGSSYEIIAAAVEIAEGDRVLLNTMPYCEPQLGRRGLYDTSGDSSGAARNMALLWVLNLSDGTNSLLEIAERADMPFRVISEAARLLEEKGLLVDASAGAAREGAPRQANTETAKSGHRPSFSETTVGEKGQSIAKAGSSCRTPRAALGS